MFEGKHPFANSGPGTLDARGGGSNAQPSQALVRMEWNALVARLGAARELRGALATPVERHAAPASFDARSARRLHAQADGRLALNHEISANGNANRRSVRVSEAARPEGSTQNGDPRK